MAVMLCFGLCSFAQKSDYNLNFEVPESGKKLPLNWFEWGKGYEITTDSVTVHTGKKSIRLKPGTNMETAFGCAVTEIPAHYGTGSIVLTGYLKTENVDGYAGLIMRIDGENGALRFDNMNARGVKGTSDWKKYSIDLDLPEQAKAIYVGVIMKGSGVVWADNFHVSINGADVATLSPIPQKEYKASFDKEFDNGSGISKVPTDKTTIDNLTKLGLLWGYAKYHHPGIGTGNYNWDYELFRLLPAILVAKTNQQRDEAIYNKLKSLGEFKTRKPEKVNPKDAVLLPDLAWIENSGFSANLTQLLVKMKDAERAGKGYYIGINHEIGNAEFTNEKDYPKMDYTDTGYRLLGLYRYWNMIQYYFPYKNLITEDWKDVLREFIPKFISANDETTYKLAMLELIGRVHDTHANIYSDKALDKWRGNNFSAVNLKFIDNEPVVVGFYNDELGKKTGLKKGDAITLVNGKPIEQIIEEKQKYSPASNYPTQLRVIASNMLRSNDSIITLQYRRDNKLFTTKITAYPAAQPAKFTKQAQDTCFRMIIPKIAYIDAGTLKNDYVPKIKEALKGTDGLIIDMREYPADFIVFSVSSLFTRKNADFVKFTKASTASPGLFTYTPKLNILKSPDHYSGKVIVLIDEGTQSNGEYTTMAFRAGGARVIGSTTAGADGNITAISLPGGLRTVITGIGVYYPDGKETQRIGIVPDIEVKPTIAGIKAGKDELLDKAVEIINKK